MLLCASVHLCSHCSLIIIVQCYQSEGVSSAICEKWCESRDIYFFRFNPLLEENIPVPEEVSLDALINVAIKTITHIATEDGKENLERLQKEL